MSKHQGVVRSAMLVAITPGATRLVLTAVQAKTSFDIARESMIRVLPDDEQLKMLNEMYVMGQLDVLKHAAATFIISDISRNAQYSLMQYDTMAYTTQDTVNVNLFKVPDGIQRMGNPELVKHFVDTYRKAQSTHKWLKSMNGVAAKDAHMVMPLAVVNQVVVTMNFKQLLQFFESALCPGANTCEELRWIAGYMLVLLLPKDDLIFRFAGPYCMMHGGQCNKGARSCNACYKRQEHLLQDMGLEDE